MAAETETLGRETAGRRTAAGGAPLAPGVRSAMEQYFRHDFSRVRIHDDASAAALARDHGADAVCHGADIAFAADRYRPETRGGMHLLAHELAHVAQQTGGTGMAAPAPVPAADASEKAADAAAQALLAGRPLPPLGRYPMGTRCAVKTNGGEFDTTAYSAINDASKAKKNGVGKEVGAFFRLKFTPNELVEADLIGMIQTVRTLRSGKAGGAVDQTSFPSKHKAGFALGKGEGEEGRVIDQTDTGKGNAPNTSPLYAVDNAPGNIAQTLTDVQPVAGTSLGQHGFRKKKADGSYDVQDAKLGDRPHRDIEFPKQEWKQTFEVTALVLSGPMTNTYLGSIEWGWTADATGNATLDPNPIRLVRAGVPTASFMDASKKWNAAKSVKDPATKGTHETVDLPIVEDTLDSGSKPAVERSTAQLLAWHDMAVSQASGAGVGAVDKTNKDFEKRAIESALATRRVELDVKVNKTEDWTGADEVYPKLLAGSTMLRGDTRDLNDGQRTRYTFPVTPFIGARDGIRVQVYDEDTGTFFDKDDLIVDMQWRSPYVPGKNTKSFDGANYDVLIKFDK